MKKKNKVRTLKHSNISGYNPCVDRFNEYLIANSLNYDCIATHQRYFYDLEKNTKSKYNLKLNKFAILRSLADHFIVIANYKRMAEFREFYRTLKYYPADINESSLTLPSSKDIISVLVFAKPTEYCLVYAYYYSGARLKELLQLRLDNLTVKAKYVICPTIGKGKRPRKFILPIEIYRLARKIFKGNKFLFETVNGKQLAKSTTEYLVREAGKRAGVTITPRILRKCTVNHFRNQFPNFDQEIFCGIMGHSKSTQDRYYRQYDLKNVSTYNQFNTNIKNKIKKSGGRAL